MNRDHKVQLMSRATTRDELFHIAQFDWEAVCTAVNLQFLDSHKHTPHPQNKKIIKCKACLWRAVSFQSSISVTLKYYARYQKLHWYENKCCYYKLSSQWLKTKQPTGISNKPVINSVNIVNTFYRRTRDVDEIFKVRLVMQLSG